MMPLAAGIVDDLTGAGPVPLVRIHRAELEWSKDFAKEIMVKYGVPTAAYGTFSDFEEAKAYIEEKRSPYRCQGGWIGAGKGVVV